jgi:hypothetical protein
MPTRGTYQFEVQANGNLVDKAGNIELARRLFRDGTIISGRWGPGQPGDFDYGSWHCLCHLAAGAGVYLLSDRYLWVSITHAGTSDKYVATVSTRETGGSVRVIELGSAEGSNLISRARLLGYVEGTSEGHILARNVQDPPEAFNGWPRQMFNQPVSSLRNGGTVWEHWCTTRDLRPSDPIGDSILKAYLTLVSTLGGQFTATVARGRRQYNHPDQLRALVRAGFIEREDALWDTMPYEIPREARRLLLEARPADNVEAIGSLPWTPSGDRRYFMFRRRISSWCDKRSVESSLDF